ncbi:MAG: energy-coupling factor transporter transmembrane protein EcfT [Eubacteriaceae bacterium]|nr:energy-coupling factor transporter transmembrane protein EcfT [Eubacteriaceae bacterium]
MKFDSYHPTINFLYFTSVIVMSISFDHPVFLVMSYVMSYLYSAKLYGKKAFLGNLLTVPFIIFFAWFYSYYNHFGVTYLSQNFTENYITLEAVIYGAVIGIKISSVIMWLECVFEILCTDKVIYLFGRLSPKLSLFISITLRMVPRVIARAKKINTAQRGIGRGAGQGQIVEKVKNSIRLVSMTVTWTLENLVDSAVSMKNRGYSLKGRTAFSIYRFDNRDRIIVIILMWMIFLITFGYLLDQTNITYDPMIIMNKITPVSCVFYISYFIFGMLPLMLQVYGEKKFAMQRKKA